MKANIQMERFADGSINIWVDDKPLILRAKPLEALRVYFNTFKSVEVETHEFIMNCGDIATLRDVL